MTLRSQVDRSRTVQKLAALKDSVAQSVSDEFFVKHPEWLDRYGERGRQFCSNDVRFHLEFLSGAIEAGSPESFADYALWTARMLDARGIACDSLKENFAQIGQHLSAMLSAAEYSDVSGFLEGTSGVCLESAAVPEARNSGDELRLTRDVFLSAILSGQRQAALNIVEEALRTGHPRIDIYVDVFGEALHEVGRRWEANKITVAQEHMATAITQYAIASVYPRMVPSGPARGRMIVTGVSGELHQIGANLVADAMESKGWDVRFLGSNLPHKSIVEAIEDISADVLCISTTIVANVPAAGDLIRSVRGRLGDRAPRIVLGGSAYRFATSFAKDAGASGPATDLRQALALLCA